MNEREVVDEAHGLLCRFEWNRVRWQTTNVSVLARHTAVLFHVFLNVSYNSITKSMSKQKVFSTNCAIVDSVREFCSLAISATGITPCLQLSHEQHVSLNVCHLHHILSQLDYLFLCERFEAIELFSTRAFLSTVRFTHFRTVEVGIDKVVFARVGATGRSCSSGAFLTQTNLLPLRRRLGRLLSQTEETAHRRNCSPARALPSRRSRAHMHTALQKSPGRLPPETLRLGLQQSMMSKLYQY